MKARQVLLSNGYNNEDIFLKLKVHRRVILENSRLDKKIIEDVKNRIMIINFENEINRKKQMRSLIITIIVFIIWIYFRYISMLE